MKTNFENKKIISAFSGPEQILPPVNFSQKMNCVYFTQPKRMNEEKKTKQQSKIGERNKRNIFEQENGKG